MRHYPLLDALLALDMAVQCGANQAVCRRLWLAVCREFMELQMEREDFERMELDIPEHAAIMDPFGGMEVEQCRQ